jgi:photosystem II stability/assembly factor-like uncharacterized protein
MKGITLMVGTQKGAFFLRSDERRKDWQLSAPIMKGWSVFDVVRDTRSTPRLYAAVGHFVYGPTVQISDDFGESWQQAEQSPRYAEDSPHKVNNVWCVVPGRASDPDTLYAGVDEAGLFVSHDRGRQWEEIEGLTNHPTREEWCPGAGGLCCHSICVHPQDAGRLWIGISAVGVFRSTDGGASWQASNDGLPIVIEGKTHKDVGTCVHHMILDPRNPDRLFQQNHQGVFRSTNGGKNWKRIEEGLPHIFGFPMVMLPNDSDTLFIVPQESDEFRFANEGQLAVYRSTNGGDSWQALRDGLPDNAYAGVLRQAMTTDTCDDPGIYFGTNTGQIFYSRDGGDHWEQMPCILPRIQSLSVAITEE